MRLLTFWQEQGTLLTLKQLAIKIAIGIGSRIFYSRKKSTTKVHHKYVKWWDV